MTNQACKAITEEILAERLRQIEAEGFSLEHDDLYRRGELARAGAVYAMYAAMGETDRDITPLIGPQLYGASALWPWDDGWFKLTTRRHDLVKACALLIAEIERLDRAAAGSTSEGENTNG